MENGLVRWTGTQNGLVQKQYKMDYRGWTGLKSEIGMENGLVSRILQSTDYREWADIEKELVERVDWDREWTGTKNLTKHRLQRTDWDRD